MHSNLGPDPRSAAINEKLTHVATELCRLNGFASCYIVVGCDDGNGLITTVDGHFGDWPIPLGVVLEALSHRAGENPEVRKMWS